LDLLAEKGIKNEYECLAEKIVLINLPGSKSHDHGMVKKILIWTLITIVLTVGFFYINLKVFEKRTSRVTEGTPIEHYHDARAALLVIDIQEYTTGEVSVKQSLKGASDDLIRKVNEIAERSAEQGITVIYIRNEISDPIINLMNSSMAVGSTGARLDSRLNIVSDHIIPKEKQDAFSNPRLDSLLISHKISRLYVVGLDAAYCVNRTIEGAMNRGYDIAVISDAIISDPDSVKYHMLEEFAERGVEILSANEFLMNETY
jgi:nicotinamidase/pyrazinamidase